MEKKKVTFIIAIFLFSIYLYPQDTLFPPQDIHYNIDCFNGTFYWEEPDSCDCTLLGYFFYSDSVANPSFITPNITSKDFIVEKTIDTIIFGVSALYFVNSVQQESIIIWKDTITNNCDPPNNVDGVRIYPASRFTYTSWSSPVCFDPYVAIIPINEIIFKGQGDYSGEAYGTNGIQNYSCAHRWTTEFLEDFDSCYITEVSFVPTEYSAIYNLRIWNGANATNLLYDQVIISPIIGEWNTIQIEDTIYIDNTKELWIGYHVSSLTGYPAGLDSGPVVSGGDMITDYGVWLPLHVIYTDFDNNWSIKARIEKYENQSLAFDLYASENYNGPYEKVNNELIYDTVYFAWDQYLRYIYVSAVYDNCVSNSDTILTDATSGLSDPKSSQFIVNVFPQPAISSITISADIEICEISIFNNQGSIIFNRKDIHKKDTTLDISTIPSGVYIVEIRNSMGFARKKVLIN